MNGPKGLTVGVPQKVQVVVCGPWVRITRRTIKSNHEENNLDDLEGEEPEDVFEDAVEDDVADPNMKMMVKLRGEVVE